MIRKYREEDFDTLCDIAERAYRPIFEGFEKQLGRDVYEIYIPGGGNSKTPQLRKQIETRPDQLLVAERNGRIVGFIMFFLDSAGRIGRIGNNAVDPLCGEKGVGQEMYRAVLDIFRREGMRLACVNTGLDEAHAPARRAYGRAGFNLSSESVTYMMKLDGNEDGSGAGGDGDGAGKTAGCPG